MDYARASRCADWVFAGLVVQLQATLFLWPERGRPTDFLVAAGHDAQLFASIALILAWAALGPGRWWVRAGALPVLLALWFLPWNTRMLPRETDDSFPLTVALCAGLIVVGLRASQLQVARLPPGGREAVAQFSIFSLLVATTLIAVAVGLLEWLRPTLSNLDSSTIFVRSPIRTSRSEGFSIMPATVRQLVLAVATAGAGIGGIWVVLRPGGIWLRAAALIISLAAAGFYLPQLSGTDSQQLRSAAVNLALGLAVIASLAALTVLPLRLMGFRLQRPAKAAAASPAPTPASAVGRRQLVYRVTAILGLVLLVLAGIPLARKLHHSYGQTLESPTQSFTHFVYGRRRPYITIRGMPYRLYLSPSRPSVDFILEREPYWFDPSPPGE